MTVTEEQVTAALREHAQQWATDAWSFGGPAHSTEDARAITRACLTLGVPVTDVFTVEVWTALMDRVIQTEVRIARLEQHMSGGVLGQ